MDIAVTDGDLSCMQGQRIGSERSAGVRYELLRPIGAGGSARAFLALRQAAEGQCPVVVKVLYPGFVQEAGPEAAKAVVKEAVALGRLNERVPPTPFVVKLVDTGAVTVVYGDRSLALPWLALEYVHGGTAGTTLTERVANSIDSIGTAFDCARATRAIDCLARGLAAAHEVGVIHRDLKPDNVFCCGAGDEELLKVADFNVARSSGLAATFHGAVGTIGYSAPELVDGSSVNIGPWTDVFSLAAVVYFLLTGEEYFPVRSLVESLVRIRGTERPSLLDAPRLSPELRERPIACNAISASLAQATSAKTSERPVSVAAFAASVLPWLQSDSWRSKRSFRPTGSMPPPPIEGWEWMVRHVPADEVGVRSVAWDVDGTCLVATGKGLAHWDGTRLRAAPMSGIPQGASVRFVSRLAPGRWLLACDDSVLAVYTLEGITEVMRFSDAQVQLERFSGDLGDLAAAVGRSEDGVCLLGLSGHRWVRSVPLASAASVLSLARVEDARWLVTGRSQDGTGFVALYSPLDCDAEMIPLQSARAMIACAGNPGLQCGIAGGTDGVVISYEAGRVKTEALDRPIDVSAVALDGSGGAWIAGSHKLATRQGRAGLAAWETVWEDETRGPPIVSLHADAGYVVAMTADGRVLEGRATQFATMG